MKHSTTLVVLKWQTFTLRRTFPSSTTTTSSSSSESSKKSLLSVSFFRRGSLIPQKVTFQGWSGLLKSKLCPVFMGVFAHRSDVPFLNLSTHIFESRYYNKTSRCLLTAATISRNMSSKKMAQILSLLYVKSYGEFYFSP